MQKYINYMLNQNRKILTMHINAKCESILKNELILKY